jgi:hypothetical protein
MEKRVQVTTSEVENAIDSELSSFNPQHTAQIVRLLTDLFNGDISNEAIQDRLKSEPLISTMITKLAGRKIEIANKIITFGDESQYRDVTIRDVAGGDIITYQINITINNENTARINNPLATVELDKEKALKWEEYPYFMNYQYVISNRLIGAGFVIQDKEKTSDSKTHLIATRVSQYSAEECVLCFAESFSLTSLELAVAELKTYAWQQVRREPHSPVVEGHYASPRISYNLEFYALFACPQVKADLVDFMRRPTSNKEIKMEFHKSFNLNYYPILLDLSDNNLYYSNHYYWFSDRKDKKRLISKVKQMFMV